MTDRDYSEFGDKRKLKELRLVQLIESALAVDFVRHVVLPIDTQARCGKEKKCNAGTT